MAATNHFGLQSDLIGRATVGGVLYAADPTGQGSINDAAVQAVLMFAMSRADADINQSLANALLPSQIPYVQDDGSLNNTLRYWWIDLAVYYAATNGGHGYPEQLKDAYDAVQKKLVDHAARRFRIAGIVYPGDGFKALRYANGRPRVYNPGSQLMRGSIGDRYPGRRRHG